MDFLRTSMSELGSVLVAAKSLEGEFGPGMSMCEVDSAGAAVFLGGQSMAIGEADFSGEAL